MSSGKRRWTWLTLAVLASLAARGAAAQETTEAEELGIVINDAVSVGLQQLYVTVTRGRQRVLDLEASHFTVVDDGAPQEIVTFERGDIPFTAVLMLDGSGSMYGERLNAALAGARAFVGGMRAFDEARLMVVADRLLEVSPFVGRGEPLAAALEGTAATGGTALFDYLFLAFSTLESRQGRRVVVLLSDGYDIHSVLAADELREVVRRSRALFYWLRLRGPKNAPRIFPRSAWRHPKIAGRDFKQLAKAVRDTGGRTVDVSSTEEMGPALREILAELREQYAIGYYPTPRASDGAWRRVEVKVRRSGVKPRWRPVYFVR